MVPAESFRQFVTERLAAAAEEIFRVFQRTVAEYEEELDRQRRLLDVAWRPRVLLQRIELPQQHVCKEEEVLTDQWLRNPRLDQEEPEPPQVKEEQEELCCTLQLGLKQEPDDFIVTTVSEGHDRGEVQTRDRNPAEAVDVPVISSVVSTANSEQQPLSDDSAAAESQDQKGGNGDDSRSAKNGGAERGHHQQKSRRPTDDVSNPTVLKMDVETPTDEKRHTYQSRDEKLFQHDEPTVRFRSYTVKKAHVCTTCKKAFSRKLELVNHMAVHTGEKTCICPNCGKAFRTWGYLRSHMRVHRVERLGRKLKKHKRIHTGEKPFICTTCGRGFRIKGNLTTHMRTHTGEKPYRCKACGKDFTTSCLLSTHMRIHTGERPYACKTCGRRFVQSSHLFKHTKTIHSDKAPRSNVPSHT